jgi:hypothetical protein
MADEKEVCEECGAENTLDVVYFGKMTKLCSTCARMNGAVIIHAPTTEQISRAERAVSLQERVKAWRKERSKSPKEANLDTLRRRKHEIERNKEKQDQEAFRKEIAEAKSIIDFRSKEVTISDLKKMPETPFPQRTQIKQEPIDEELRIHDFIQEVNRVQDEEQLEKQLEIPKPIEPLNLDKIDEENKEEDKKEES